MVLYLDTHQSLIQSFSIFKKYVWILLSLTKAVNYKVSDDWYHGYSQYNSQMRALLYLMLSRDGGCKSQKVRTPYNIAKVE